jgi:hypothetical protein
MEHAPSESRPGGTFEDTMAEAIMSEFVDEGVE